MRILVITSDPRWASAVRVAFPGGHDVVTGDSRQMGGMPALLPVIDACFVAENELGLATVEVLKQLAGVSNVPLFAVADVVRPEWEEAALIAGAQQVFSAPMRSGLVQLAVSRAARNPAQVGIRDVSATTAQAKAVPPHDGAELALLRDFSRMLSDGGAEQGRFALRFLGLLRDVLGSSRAILFRRAPAEPAFELEAAAGVDARQFDGFRLHLGHGLGRLVNLRGNAVVRSRLRTDLPEEASAMREMSAFGAEIAVPVMASSGCSGVLLVGARIAGSEYSDAEITQLYHVMEAFAVRSEQQIASGAEAQVAADILPPLLHAMPVGCALLDATLRVLDTNDTFQAQLGRKTANPLGIERLPVEWSTALQTLRDKRDGGAQVELDHELSGAQRRIRLTLHPVGETPVGSPRWLMVTEDITNETRMRQELHDRSVRNVLQRAGEQLSNEFRNALTPIEIMVQLSGEANGRQDIERLRAPVSMAIHRLRRRVDNLGYLTKASLLPEMTSVSGVFRSARERLDNWLEAKQLKTLVWSGEFSKVAFTADSSAIGLAIAELVMNAVEAAGGRQVTISADDLPEAVHFRVRNPGEWAPPAETTGFGHRPFFTAKSAGVGLGVEVVSRVAEYHGGRLQLGPVASDVVEAVLRLPRSLPVVPLPSSGANAAPR